MVLWFCGLVVLWSCGFEISKANRWQHTPNFILREIEIFFEEFRRGKTLDFFFFGGFDFLWSVYPLLHVPKRKGAGEGRPSNTKHLWVVFFKVFFHPKIREDFNFGRQLFHLGTSFWILSCCVTFRWLRIGISGGLAHPRHFLAPKVRCIISDSPLGILNPNCSVWMMTMKLVFLDPTESKVIRKVDV